MMYCVKWLRKELRFIMQVLAFLKIKVELPMVAHVENQSTIFLAKNMFMGSMD